MQLNGHRDSVSPLWKVRNVCCIGAGYVGGPTSAVIASKNPSVGVTVTDINERRISAWKSNRLPIFEPGLLETVQEARDGSASRRPNLFFTTDIEAAIGAADLIFVAVNTPTKTSGRGVGRASETGFLESAIRTIAEVAETDKIIVEKSTVPLGTAGLIREILDAIGNPGVHFEVLSNPEFLAEGTALKDLLLPDRILIGSLSSPSGISACDTLRNLYSTWVPQSKIITTHLLSSELAKLAANAMLGQRITNVNSLSAICEATGANIEEVSNAVGLDFRIGPKMLNASVGFGGSCFKKDILSLAYIAETLHLPEIAAYWTSVLELNEYQKDRFAQRIVRCLYSTLTNKKIAILGFAFKKNTGDTRESPAISICQALLDEGAQITLYDPKVPKHQIWADLVCNGGEGTEENITICETAYQACHDVNAVVILTEWDEFSNRQPVEPARMDWERVAKTMRQPRYVFDGRNITDAVELQKLGLRVEHIGKSL
ncbi:UDP-glucose dehydrogenase [Viridothelium virens]|uniref:UDP-glucose 6-dehydrogenase n=1 Tax=Viridothelium virens TaxID=1048519 RepID=A0A6A6GWF7_VIRVR|nr:UDP-glucose dehydrogenase [Viridothelium virens]